MRIRRLSLKTDAANYNPYDVCHRGVVFGKFDVNPLSYSNEIRIGARTLSPRLLQNPHHIDGVCVYSHGCDLFGVCSDFHHSRFDFRDYTNDCGMGGVGSDNRKHEQEKYK